MTAYKYLGIQENHKIEHRNGNTELSTKNKLQTTGTLAVPVLRYSFGIINWHQEEIQTLDRDTRKMLTIHGQHHPRADDRLHFPRKEVGRGMVQIKRTYIAELTKLMENVESKEDPLIQVVRTHQHQTQHYFKQLRILRNMLKVKRGKKIHNS
jgi:hypothetical protein